MNQIQFVPHPPSIKRNSFNCPHCGAHADQFWYELYAKNSENSTPNIMDESTIKMIEEDPNIPFDLKEDQLDWIRENMKGFVHIDRLSESKELNFEIRNLFLSKCYSCKKIAVWIHDKLVFPKQKYQIASNFDLPDDIKNDYNEASAIFDDSPRGAAAILRLAIQKLCMHLKQPGKNINSDIQALVKAGLDVQVQQALDFVRVIGNNAVHPGNIDIEDNKETVLALFGLINLIAEKMISEPKHVNELFDSLPDGVKEQIKKRDK